MADTLFLHNGLGSGIKVRHSQRRHASCLAIWDAPTRGTWDAPMLLKTSLSAERIIWHIARMVESSSRHSRTSHSHSSVTMGTWSDEAAGCAALGCAQATGLLTPPLASSTCWGLHRPPSKWFDVVEHYK